MHVQWTRWTTNLDDSTICPNPINQWPRISNLILGHVCRCSSGYCITGDRNWIRSFRHTVRPRCNISFKKCFLKLDVQWLHSQIHEPWYKCNCWCCLRMQLKFDESLSMEIQLGKDRHFYLIVCLWKNKVSEGTALMGQPIPNGDRQLSKCKIMVNLMGVSINHSFCCVDVDLPDEFTEWVT